MEEISISIVVKEVVVFADAVLAKGFADADPDLGQVK